jgi:F0F1-type ATP synthase membrane subunit b/b'|uniref:Uncharacterized protein n=1 Tax=Myoviridae sp. ctPuP5 TaxID=2823543 RepID=A0A8S5L9E1_9CAUD|nr:MAG TPA: hypothetical protein [Myoviridae sp. ctPuP5]
MIQEVYNDYGFIENDYLYTLPEERRDWRIKIENEIEEAKVEINTNVDEAEEKVSNDVVEAKNEINTNVENSKEEVINELHTTVNSYVINAKNEIISNDNSNKENILTTIKGWLKI